MIICWYALLTDSSFFMLNYFYGLYMFYAKHFYFLRTLIVTKQSNKKNKKKLLKCYFNYLKHSFCNHKKSGFNYESEKSTLLTQLHIKEFKYPLLGRICVIWMKNMISRIWQSMVVCSRLKLEHLLKRWVSMKNSKPQMDGCKISRCRIN